MAPVVKAFQSDTSFETKVCVTAQHREMLDQVLNFFDISPDFDLNLMRPGQNLYQLTADIITNLKTVLEDYQPDYVFVHGDTTTTMAGSLAAFYSGAKVCHVEAGLRTYNKLAPFPEEINRTLTGHIADYHFAPTEQSKNNLLKENIDEENILVTGNTVIDALLGSVEKVNAIINDGSIEKLKQLVNPEQKLVLVTAHRRENHGQGFLDICAALKEIAEDKNVQVIYPVHLNPNVQEPVYRLLSDSHNVHLIDPLPYPSFVWLMDKSHSIITDSGGIQEEAPSLGKPVLVMRETTERPEAVDAGTVILVGTDKEKIVKEAKDIINNSERYMQMSRLHNPYGDGNAAKRIVEFIKNTAK